MDIMTSSCLPVIHVLEVCVCLCVCGRSYESLTSKIIVDELNDLRAPPLTHRHTLLHMNKTSVRRDQGVCDHVSHTIDRCRVTGDDPCLGHTLGFIYSLCHARKALASAHTSEVISISNDG